MANDEGFGDFREEYRLESFSGRRVMIANRSERPDDLMSALAQICPKCRAGSANTARDGLGWQPDMPKLKNFSPQLGELLPIEALTTPGVDFMHEWVDENVTDAWRPASREFVAALLNVAHDAPASYV